MSWGSIPTLPESAGDFTILALPGISGLVNLFTVALGSCAGVVNSGWQKLEDLK